MPILIIAGVAILVGLIVWPAWQTRRILDRYAEPVDYLPGTGGQLASHLVRLFELPVEIEKTEVGDHYDPLNKTVRLTERVMDKSSLTAVAVAAHEVGHAIQDHTDSSLLRLRTRLVTLLRPLELLASLLFFIAPAITFWSGRTALLLLALGIAALLSRVLVHLITLPVEFDASFGKALPILQEGKYLREQDQAIVKKILRACAMTYVSSALLELVNVYRWIRFFRK